MLPAPRPWWAAGRRHIGVGILAAGADEGMKAGIPVFPDRNASYRTGFGRPCSREGGVCQNSASMVFGSTASMDAGCQFGLRSLSTTMARTPST